MPCPSDSRRSSSASSSGDRLFPNLIGLVGLTASSTMTALDRLHVVCRPPSLPRKPTCPRPVPTIAPFDAAAEERSPRYLPNRLLAHTTASEQYHQSCRRERNRRGSSEQRTGPSAQKQCGTRAESLQLAPRIRSLHAQPEELPSGCLDRGRSWRCRCSDSVGLDCGLSFFGLDNSVVIPSLQKINAVSAYAIHQAVLLREAARPATREDVFQRLRLSDPRKWVAQDAFDEFECTERNLAVGFNPVTKILPELGMKYGFPVNVAWQVPSPAVTCLKVPVCPSRSSPVAGPR